jgi:hypothetical protein
VVLTENGDWRCETYDIMSEMPSKQSMEIDLAKGLDKENWKRPLHFHSKDYK